MEQHARLITRIASLGFALVFVALVLCTMWGAATMRHAATLTLASVTLSQRYELLERQLSTEASLVRVHGFDPEGSGWNEERPAAILSNSTLNAIDKIGDERDRQTVRATLADHERYMDVLLVLFSQIDNSAPGVGVTFKHSMDISSRMLARIDAQAAEHHQAATVSLAQLDATQSVVVRTIMVASGAGLVLLIVCLFVLTTYRNNLELVRRREVERLAVASLTDTLTGLGNHRSYQDDLEREIAALSRHGGQLTLALIDIDHFKGVNDRHGHIHGDAVLTALGKLLQTVRKSDRGYRLGGDEFAVILPFTGALEAFTVVDRLRRSAPAVLHGSTLSIGLASTGDTEADPITLRSQADAALYAAKRLGRNSVMAYGDSCAQLITHFSENGVAHSELPDLTFEVSQRAGGAPSPST